MINSTSPSDRTPRAEPVVQAQPKDHVRGLEADRFAAKHSETLRAALAAQPEVRPEVVARGKALAADPNYPSTDILRSVAGLIVGSPDLSDDVS